MQNLRELSDEQLWEKIIKGQAGAVDLLIERYKGAFPTWLAPVQAKIIPVNLDIHGEFANQLQEQMQAKGLRVEVDTRNEKMGYKIREAQTLKIPYQLVIGDNEIEDGTVAVRKYGEKKTETLSIEEFIDTITEESTK